MSLPSQWPLTQNAARFIAPDFIQRQLNSNPMTKGCYLTAFGFYPSASNHKMRRQSHDDNLLIYCVEGQGHLTTKHFSGSVKEGDLALLPAEQAHEYAADSNNPWTIYWLHFAGEQAATLLEELSYNKDSPIINVGILPLAISDWKRLLGLRRSGYSQTLLSYGSCLVQQILLYLAWEIRRSKALHRENFNLDVIQGFMHENLDQKLDLDALAATANLSKYHFASKYKKITGYSPIKHFIHLKIEQACHLLDTTSLSISRISNQLGYEDPLYFSRQFKKVMGLSPSQYRQKH